MVNLKPEKALIMLDIRDRRLYQFQVKNNIKYLFSSPVKPIRWKNENQC